ncbi:MAG: hypothetical protein IKB70_07020 [Bacilli bacterium]|nr:hypothetical protein [Bacilli bacterium]
MEKKKTDNTAKKINFWHIMGIVGLGFAALGVAGGAVSGIRHAVIQHEKEKVYSVTFDLENAKVKGKRGDSAIGMEAGINGEKNDFDKAYPWKAIKEVKDANGDYFVRIPKFYEKITQTETTLTYSITSAPKKGYHVAPAFIEAGEEIDYFDVAQYETSFNDRKAGGIHVQSIPNAMPEITGHTLDQYRALAAADGNQLFNWRQNQALQSLFAVEFANLDSQAIMSGETQYIALYHEITAEEIAAKTVSEFTLSEDETMLIDNDVDKLEFAKANLKHVDISYEYTNEDEETVNVNETVTAKSVKFENDVWTVTLDKAIDTSVFTEDAGIYISFGSYICHKTGASVGRKGSSNGASLKSLEVTAMNYRGIENWYGNTYTWCDGLATYQDANGKYICVSMDSTKDGDRDSYKKFEITGETGDHKGSMDLGDGLFINDFKMDGEVEYQYDYNYFGFQSNEYRIGMVGGRYAYGNDAVAFSVGVIAAVSGADNSVRLSCIPQAQ